MKSLRHIFYVFVDVLWNISSIDYRIDSISVSEDWSLHFLNFRWLSDSRYWSSTSICGKKNLQEQKVHKYIIFFCANIVDLMISVFESGTCIRSLHVIFSLNLERVSFPEIRRIIITKWWSKNRIFHYFDIIFHV